MMRWTSYMTRFVTGRPLGRSSARRRRSHTQEDEARMKKRVATTKEISLVRQLFELGQLTLAPEFQRNSVWPKPAKAYLIDTILNDRPVPPLFFQRVQSVQTGKPHYAIIDGQQRLRAIFEFLDDRFRLGGSAVQSAHQGKLFSQLQPVDKDAILNYALDVQELYGYDDPDIIDIFERMNKYVVKLSAQELRHARQGNGKFAKFAERIGKWKFWAERGVFSGQQQARMKNIEFAAELGILLIEGAQDKKSSIDLYYGEYKDEFEKAKETEALLKSYLDWIEKAIPNLRQTRYRSPTDLYSLVGAIHQVSNEGKRLSVMPARDAGRDLLEFAAQTKNPDAKDDAARYVVAASRQTDNIQPRNTRIEILSKVLRQD